MPTYTWTAPVTSYAVGQVLGNTDINTINNNIGFLSTANPAKLSAGTIALPATAAPIAWPTIEFDPGGHCTSGSGAGYTAPVAGYYDVCVNFIQTNDTTTGTASAYVFLNGAVQAQGQSLAKASGQYNGASVHTIVQCGVGGLIQGGGVASVASNTYSGVHAYNFMTVHFIGQY